MKSIGPPREIAITGCLLPWNPTLDQPVFLVNDQEGWPLPLLPIFSSEEKLRHVLTWMQAPKAIGIKCIDDGAKFLASVRGKVIVALDPHQKPGGKIGFTGVFLPGDYPQGEEGVAT